MMDKTQLLAFLRPMLDDRPVGVDSDGNESGTPICAELKAMITARLGDLAPPYAYYVLRSSEATRPADREPATMMAKALAALLRELADGVDPPKAAEQDSEEQVFMLRSRVYEGGKLGPYTLTFQRVFYSGQPMVGVGEVILKGDESIAYAKGDVHDLHGAEWVLDMRRREKS